MTLFIATTGKDRFCVEHFEANTAPHLRDQSFITISLTSNHLSLSGLDFMKEPENDEGKTRCGLRPNQYSVRVPVEVLQAITDAIMETGRQLKPVDLSVQNQRAIRDEVKNNPEEATYRAIARRFC